MTSGPVNGPDDALQDEALIALRRAVEKVMQEHFRLRIPVHIWENEKVVEISPNELRERYLSRLDK